MSTSELSFLTILVMAVVAIFALFRFNKRVILILKWLGASLTLDGSNGPKDTPSATRDTKIRKLARDKTIEQPPASPEKSPLAAWFSRYGKKILIPVALLAIFVIVPVWWWRLHSEAWKLVLSDHLSEVWVLLKQEPKGPVHVSRSEATLHKLTQMFDGYANVLGRDVHRKTDVWIVDHYWQYWTTDTFNEYIRANRRFVDSGGKIHRMFILTEDELQNPSVKAVLRSQCEKIGADVWRGDSATIGNKVEYQIAAKAFQQLPYTETGFQTFDVLQLEDMTYYSSDFSPDYRVVGASTWFYGQTLDLKPLFSKSVAQRIDCSWWKTPQVARQAQ